MQSENVKRDRRGTDSSAFSALAMSQSSLSSSVVAAKTAERLTPAIPSQSQNKDLNNNNSNPPLTNNPPSPSPTNEDNKNSNHPLHREGSSNNKLFGFLDLNIKSPKPPKSPSSSSSTSASSASPSVISSLATLAPTIAASSTSSPSEFSISTPTNFQQKTHVDKNWNWSGEDLASQFTLSEKLGSGAYGTVYKCVHESGTVLAAKVIPITKHDATDIMKEVDVLKSCNHPHIVQYFGSANNAGSLWILMDYCGAGSLADVLKRCHKNRLNEEQLSCVMVDVLKGLIYLHSKQIIHRDLKAGNILLTDTGEVKIADFGVSAKINNQLSKTRTVIGTPLYMAPEMFDAINYDLKADIWSLGITVIELAQGKPPNSDLNPMQVIVMVSSGEVPTFDVESDHGSSLKEFVSLCLQIDPKKRPSAPYLINHAYVVSGLMNKESKAIIQELASQRELTRSTSVEPTKSQGSSPRSSISDGGPVNLADESKIIDDRYLPDNAEDLKLLVIQLRQRIKQQQQLNQNNSTKNKLNEDLIASAKKSLNELEDWKKHTKRLEDDLKEILKKDKKLKELNA